MEKITTTTLSPHPVTGQDIKNILKRQEGRYDIDKLMAEYNSVARAGMDASPANLFFNHVVRSTTPGSGRRNLDLERAQQKRVEEQHGIRKNLGRGWLSQKGNRMRVQDVKSKKWTIKGTVVSEVYHEGAQAPSSYHIQADTGGQLLRIGKFM